MSVQGFNIQHKFARYFAIIPDISRNSHHEKRTLCDILHGTTFIALFIITMIYLMYGKITSYGYAVHYTILVTFFIMEVITTILNILSVYRLNLRHGQRFKKFLNTLKSLEIYIINKSDVETSNKNSLVMFFIITITAGIFACFSGYVYVTSAGWSVYK